VFYEGWGLRKRGGNGFRLRTIVSLIMQKGERQRNPGRKRMCEKKSLFETIKAKEGDQIPGDSPREKTKSKKSNDTSGEKGEKKEIGEK